MSKAKTQFEVGMPMEGFPGADDGWMSGKGGSEEEAIEDLLRKIRRNAEFSQVFPNGSSLPLEFVKKKLPKEGVPKTHGLVVLEYWDDKVREVLRRRIFAIPKNQTLLYVVYGASGDRSVEEATAGDDPVVCAFYGAYRFGKYHFILRLPQKSLEFVGKKWVTRSRVWY